MPFCSICALLFFVEERMDTVNITQQLLEDYEKHLQRSEKCHSTIAKYMRYARAFAVFLTGSSPTKDAVLAWKQGVTDAYTAAGANGMIAAINSLMGFLERDDLKVASLRVQRKLFVAPEKELTRGELDRIVASAESDGRVRLALIIRTLFATGIRVSELRYITVEATKSGQSEVRLKGKVRAIFLPAKLCALLRRFAQANGIVSGSIFVSKTGKSLDRFCIWRGMKALAKAAGVLASKVFPHNLRHLFARTFYEKIPNLAELADIMGHSDVNTTRIYTATTGAEFRKRLESLNLIM
jgi:site-specific recombinase XerD